MRQRGTGNQKIMEVFSIDHETVNTASMRLAFHHRATGAQALLHMEVHEAARAGTRQHTISRKRTHTPVLLTVTLSAYFARFMRYTFMLD